MITVKKRYVVGLAVSIAALMTGSASAHVVVKPADALTGAFQGFTIGVPNEKDVPVTQVKLQVPEGLQYVTPTVKTGWTINVDKEGAGEDATVKSITWSGGSIPAGLRDDFGFSAKTPDKPTELQWKAYQTYDGGVTVAWDQKPSTGEKDDDSSNSGPYSITKVASKTDATTSEQADAAHSHGDTTTDEQARLMSIIALAVAFVAFIMASRLNAASKAAQTTHTAKSATHTTKSKK